MNLDFNTITVTILVVFIGGLIQGTVAFGMGIFIVISLAWLFPGVTLMPFTTLVVGVNLLELARRKKVPLRSFLSPVLVIPMILGVTVGTWLLVHVPDWGIKLTLGAVIFINGIIFTIKPPKPRIDINEINDKKWEPWSLAKACAIFFGGVLGGWLSTAGPPVIFYGYATMPAESAQRFLIRIFMLSVVLKLFTYAYSGLWTVEVFILAGVCITFVLISTISGHRIATHLPAKKLSWIAWVVFTIIGLILLIRSLFQDSIII